MARHDPQTATENAEHGDVAPFDDGVDESALLDMISGIESRLGDLRAAQQHAAPPPPAPARPHANAQDIADPSEIRERARLLDQRERDLSSREQVLVAQTERIDEECKLLEQARSQIATQREAQRQRAEELARERVALDERAKKIAAQSESGESDRAELESELQKLADARVRSEARERELNERATALDTRATKLDAQNTELVTLRERLAEQQSSLEAEAEQYAQLQVEMAALFERLSEAEQAAGAHARAGDASTPELEENWRSLENECTRLKRELSTTRKALREVEESSKTRAKSDDPAPKRAPSVERPPRAVWVFTASWLIGAALLALGVMVALTSASPAPAAILLGPAFTVSLMCAAYVARKLLSPAVIALSLAAATFGLWAPAWVEGLRETLNLWQLSLDPLPQSTHHLVPLAVAAATCSLAMTWALYLTTNSMKVLGAMLLATILIVPILLAPVAEPVPTVIAALVWHAMTAGALTRWALEIVKPATSVVTSPPPLAQRPAVF
ncbi:MAG: hypothetical protein R3B57_11195 [Phycisphaerales bacterium]